MSIAARPIFRLAHKPPPSRWRSIVCAACRVLSIVVWSGAFLATVVLMLFIWSMLHDAKNVMQEIDVLTMGLVHIVAVYVLARASNGMLDKVAALVGPK